MIANKYRMYQETSLGRWNTLNFWETKEALQASGFDGLLGLRWRDGVGKAYHHHLTVSEILKVTEGLYGDYIYAEASNDDHITIQGEASYTLDGWHLEYSRCKTHMRQALGVERFIVSGVLALMVLRAYLYGSSFDNLQDLTVLYPDHVIEFTAYDMCVGRLRGQNIIIWEVRKY